ncbi:hypothetical protein ZEAMMB73_Zm00001d025302 [Zea mays]|uniref:Uncharacterized protein n=1 Tax=Zea mays TaxID=4577 RepID=A0A1D6J6D7_MAIZE|nr:hypothetical protein ZEAMMB73_Zm00001d025302 [Zea mays]
MASTLAEKGRPALAPAPVPTSAVEQLLMAEAERRHGSDTVWNGEEPKWRLDQSGLGRSQANRSKGKVFTLQLKHGHGPGQQDSLLTVWLRRVQGVLHDGSFDADCTIIVEVSVLKTRIQPNDEAQQEVQTRSIPDPREVAGCLLHMLLQQSRPMLCLILLSTVYQLVTQYGRIPVYLTFCGGFWNYFSLDLQKIKLRKCLASESMEGE